MIKKAEYSCCRAKIDHLNLRKRYIKYTYSESTLDGLFKTLILSLEMTKFKASRWCTGWCQLLLGLKPRASLLANSSKTAEQKLTPFTQSVSPLEIRIILKNEPNRYILRGVIAIIRYGTK